jgi:Na+/phosphate symporter
MFVSIKKADVLQSIGFALTAAKEEHERVTSHLGLMLNRMIRDGEIISEDNQREIAERIKKERDAVERVDVLRRMVEFSTDEDVLLDAASFALIETNLPAR